MLKPPLKTKKLNLFNIFLQSKYTHKLMSYKIEDLQDESRFRLIRKLQYENIAEFVFENIQKANFSTRFYFIINISLLALIIGLSIAGFKNDLFTFWKFFRFFVLGFISGSIFVIPLHELLHGIAYKIIGAPEVEFGADLKQGIFYVAANNYVVGKQEFTIIALTPFIVINITAFILIGFLTPYYFILTLLFLFFHNIMCIGDFAMLSYFHINKNKEIYTYDNHEEKLSYIYEKL